LPLLPERIPTDKVAAYEGKPIVVGIRPEDLHIDAGYMNQPTAGVLNANVDLAELMGSEIYVYAKCGETNLIAKVPPHTVVETGKDIQIAVDCNKIHLFDKESGQKIS